jgi:TRAP-type C4-dicarboxylate transport system permease small subunit
MNIFQRIVLVLGAIALGLAIWYTPESVILQGTYATPNPMLTQLTGGLELQPVITPQTGIMYAVGVVGATVLLFFALQGLTIKKRAKKPKPKK